jgi:NTP pyrophosphatase (non-canonical NTP hydrolase)
MLRRYFPTTNEGASLYDGFLQHKNLFCKIYERTGTLAETIEEINLFLENNGYGKVSAAEFDELTTYDQQPVKIAPGDHLKYLVLAIERDSTALSQTEFLINELKKFRVERDWDQFHNPKDLSIALSIEANELLELFLWKKPDEANPEKVAEELADVFAYAFQLADRLQLNIEEILLKKIKHNGLKYPVGKSKGSAHKYNEL